MVTPLAGKRCFFEITCVLNFGYMAIGKLFGGKREILAHGMYWSGAVFAMSHLPARDSLVVLTYHRVGNADEDPFDPNVFSATGEQFDDQVSYLKRHHSLVTLEEALEYIEGTNKDKTPRCRILFTFDDGYLDNYEIAFPVLRSHGVQGVFFICSGLVGSGYVPWWDHVSYLVKTAQQRKFSFDSPFRLNVDLDKDGVRESVDKVILLCRSLDEEKRARFIPELKKAAGSRELAEGMRRFLNWQEAQEMIDGGMAIGAHTDSHAMLSKLEPEEQRRELVQCRAILKERLKIKADALAYPYGLAWAFSKDTQQIAEEVGYRAAFSYHGGTNRQGTLAKYDVKRVTVGSQSQTRLKVQAGTCKLTGSFWP